MRGAHNALSPIFGAPANPVPWQAAQFASQIFFPSGLAAAVVADVAAAMGAAAAAGAAATIVAAGVDSLKLAPALLAMKATARRTSSSVRSALPPFAGIAPAL